MKGTRADITRLLCFGPCQLDGWVFDESVLSLWISLSCPWLLNITRSEFLSWHSPQVWVFVESMILLGSSASCFGSLYTTRVFFDERLFGSTASKSIRLVGLLIGSWLGSFVGSLIGCCNQVKWLTLTWFPAAELRLTNAFEWLAERKIANSTKNFKRAGIAFNILMIIAFQKMPNKYFKTQSDYLLVYKPIGVSPRCDYVLTRMVLF